MPWKVIQYSDPTGDVMVSRMPPDGTAELTSGTQLIVQEGQLAVFCHDGKPTDGFWAGRYSLDTQNLPVLSGLLNLATLGQSPFRSYVLFVALKTFTNLGWGTATPVLFRDSEFKIVSLRGHGVFSIKIGNPELFLQTIVGTQGLETSTAIQSFLRSIIVSKLTQTLPELLTTVVDLPQHYQQISVRVKNAVRDEFAQYGLELVDLIIEAITLPPEVQDAINRAAGARALGSEELDRYERVARSDALRDAAKQPGGAAGAALAGGLGIGAGAQVAQGMMGGGPAGHPAGLSVEQLKAKLKDLKGLVDDGLITQEDFDAQKKRLLSQM
jgi:membrane protease subunit (stomatin/prohibitin family)